MPGDTSRAEHRPAPDHNADPTPVGADLYIQLNLLGSQLIVPTGTKAIVDFTHGLRAIMDPPRQHLVDEAEADGNASGGAGFLLWMDHSKTNLKLYRGALSQAYHHLQDTLALYGAPQLTDKDFAELDLPDPEQIDEIALNTMRRALHEQERIADKQRALVDRAQDQAARSIQGPPVHVAVTNPGMLLAAGLAELVTTHSQAKRAQKAYDEEVDRLSRWATSEMQDISRRVAFDEYYPKTIQVLDGWNDGILRAFLLQASLYDVINLEQCLGYSSNVSSEFIEQIDSSSDPRAVLAQAFEACPYDKDVYLKAAKLDLMDGETFRAAHYYGFDEHLPEALSKRFCDFLDSPEIICITADGDEPADTPEHADASAFEWQDDPAAAVRAAILEATQDDIPPL